MNHDDNTNTQLADSIRSVLSNVQLPDDERQLVRDNVVAHIEDTETRSVWSPLSNLWQPAVNTAAVVTAAVLLIVGGITYGAQSALPGDTLYAVKTNINETIASVTAVSDSQAAKTQSELAAKRLQELQTLVAQNKLTATTSKKLLDRLAKHTRSARKQIAQLRTAGNNKQKRATQLESRLTALLAAKSQALNRVAHKSNDPAVASTTRRTAQQILAIAEVATSSKLATESDASVRAAVVNLLRVTTNQFTDTYSHFRQSSSTQALPNQFMIAAHNVQSAVEDIRADAYSDAVVKLETALTQVSRIEKQSNLFAISTASSSNKRRLASTTTEKTATGTATAETGQPDTGSTTNAADIIDVTGSEKPQPVNRVRTKQAHDRRLIRKALQAADDLLENSTTSSPEEISGQPAEVKQASSTKTVNSTTTPTDMSTSTRSTSSSKQKESGNSQ